MCRSTQCKITVKSKSKIELDSHGFFSYTSTVFCPSGKPFFLWRCPMPHVVKTPLMPFCQTQYCVRPRDSRWAFCCPSRAREEVQALGFKILAAGSTEAILNDMAGAFEKESGHAVRLTAKGCGWSRTTVIPDSKEATGGNPRRNQQPGRRLCPW